jgi:hypothetical protein
VDKIGILCEKDSVMMEEFSSRSLDRIRGNSLVLASLPFFSSYFAANVKKEMDKDHLIIEEAGQAFQAGKPACDLDLEEIFEKTKAVDKRFLQSLRIPSFSLSVRYGDIADIRIQRIWRISRAVYELLREWPDTGSFADIVRKVYTGKEFKDIIMDILRLYNQETRMLSHSIRLIPPFNSAMSSLAETLFQAMESVTEDMADTYTSQLFGDKTFYDET